MNHAVYKTKFRERHGRGIVWRRRRCGFVVVWKIMAGDGEDRQTSVLLPQLGTDGWAGGWMK